MLAQQLLSLKVFLSLSQGAKMNAKHARTGFSQGVNDPQGQLLPK